RLVPVQDVQVRAPGIRGEERPLGHDGEAIVAMHDGRPRRSQLLDQRGHEPDAEERHHGGMNEDSQLPYRLRRATSSSSDGVGRPLSRSRNRCNRSAEMMTRLPMRSSISSVTSVTASTASSTASVTASTTSVMTSVKSALMLA